MTAAELLRRLRSLDVRLWVEADRLRYSAPRGVLVPELLASLGAMKAEVIALLRSTSAAEAEIPRLRRTGDGVAPSFAQQRLWFLDQFEPDAPHYNIPLAVRLADEVRSEVIAQGLGEICRRHQVLRGAFRAQGGVVDQLVLPSTRFGQPQVDLSALAAPDAEATARCLAEQEARRPFSLSRGPLLRSLCADLGAAGLLLVVNVHHIASDGWSTSVLLRELGELYLRGTGGEPSSLAELTLQYADFAAWQRRELAGARMTTELEHWREVLRGAPGLLELPTDRPRPASQTFRGKTVSFSIGAGVTRGIERLGQQFGATTFMVLLAALQTLLMRWSGQEDLCVGSPVAGRVRRELEPLIGVFVNTLVLRGELHGNPRFTELLRATRDRALVAYAHQEVPFEKLVEALQPERSLSYSPLFQVMLMLQNTPDGALDLSGVSHSTVEADAGVAKFDLTFTFWPVSDHLTAVAEYNADLFDATTIQRLVGWLRCLLADVVARPERRLWELQLTTASQDAQPAREWCEREVGDPPCSVAAPMVRIAREHPERTAVVYGEARRSYAELIDRAERVAATLQRLGVGPDTLVGLCVRRSADMVVGLLGVLFSGGAYVPMDPRYPVDRLRMMIEDGDIRTILGGEGLGLGDAVSGLRCIDLQTALGAPKWGTLAEEKGDELAYVIFTSGSTGRPKGVALRRNGVASFLASMRERPGFSAEDVLVAVTTVSFDIAGLELLLPLTCGGQVVVASAEEAMDPRQLAERLRSSGATVLQATPATWRMLLDSGWSPGPGFKALCGGEALPRDLALRLEHQGIALWNMYGPTETTIWSTVDRVDRPAAEITIGRPIENTWIGVSTRDDGAAVVGSSGEIVIGGVGVARGYVNRCALTADRFRCGLGEGARVYRVGDLGRWRRDGRSDCLGRLDFQVKVRGFRVELGEIEAVLERQPSIRQAVVMVRSSSGEGAVLVAYLVAKTAARVSVDDLRGFVGQRLPDYMVPSIWVFLDTFPLTPNGKVDRKALPAPETRMAVASYLPPRSPTESTLARIWAEVLGVERVGVNDDFFAMGGNSMLTVSLIAKIQKAFGRELPVSAVFDAPTVARLAEVVSGVSKFGVLAGIKATGDRPPVFGFHPVGGEVGVFSALASHLEPQQPLFGVQSIALDGNTPEWGSIDEMAAHYADALVVRQPEGAFRLVGFCVGGTLAITTAAVLEARGRRVEFVGLLNSALLPARSDPRPNEEVPGRLVSIIEPLFGAALGRALSGLSQRELLGYQRRLLAWKPQERAQGIFTWLIEHKHIPAEVTWSLFEKKLALASAHWAMFEGYRPPIISAPLHMWWLREIGVRCAWSEFTRAGVHEHWVEQGSHFVFMREPYVRQVASTLAALLDQRTE